MPVEQVSELRQAVREITYQYRDQLIQVMEQAEGSEKDNIDQQKTTVGIGVYWFEGNPQSGE